jgi:MerR family transcriptional regulator/heat shock protein HspR
MRALDEKKGLFTIGVAAEIIGVEPRVLRIYEEKGLIRPLRSVGNRRLYSLEDLELLEYVHYITHVRKVNLAGVKVILELLDKIPAEVRKNEITSVEKAIDKLDRTSKKIFTRGSKSVQRNLLNERRPAEIQRKAKQEVEAENGNPEE